jgi:hypothetical protein
MIELKNDQLVFSVADVHPDARMTMNFVRTLRIPDDGSNYPLPPGLGAFPVRHVDDFASRVPQVWNQHGGVMLPMYQSEALWLSLRSSYPFAVKVATGKIDAITGESWSDGLHRDPQDYMVTPGQPWLDGYCFEEGTIRQFVAMPLGQGYTVEEQLTGEAEHGGLQIVAYPMKAAAYREWLERQAAEMRYTGEMTPVLLSETAACLAEDPGMGLAPGGRMIQAIYEDPHDFDVWETRESSRCFVHITSSLAWRAVTGEDPPTTPLTSREYNDHFMPWFDYYDGDKKALDGAKKLAGVKSVKQIGEEKGEHPLPENETVAPKRVVKLGAGSSRDKVREGRF